MHGKTRIVALAAMLAVPLSLAASPPHTFIEAGYRNVDGDLDGYGAKGSFAFLPQWHGYGEFSRVTDSPLRADTGLLAVGFHHAVTPRSDLVLRGGWTQVRDRSTFLDDIEIGSLRDDGFAAQAGVRSMVTDTIELNGFVKHAEVFGGETSAAVGGVFGFTPRLGVTGGVEFTDDDTVYEVGLRFSFDG